MTDDGANALFEAGCDDATFSVRFGRVYATFTRTAPAIKEAIFSAIADIRKAGIGADILRVDVPGLVTQSDIARKIGRTRQLVNQYLTGKRGPGGFPAPACEINDGAPVWYWSEVAAWLWEHDMLQENVLREAEQVDVINSVLDVEHMRQTKPELTAEVMRAVGVK